MSKKTLGELGSFNSMLKNILFISVFIRLGFSLFQANAQVGNPYPENWQKIETQEFTVYHPVSWRKSMDGEANTRLILACPDVLDFNHFRENITLMIQDLSTLSYSMNLDTYAEISKAQLYSMIEEAAILSAAKKIQNDREYFEMVYTGKKEQFHLKWLQYYWVLNDKAYILSYTGDIKDYDKFYPTALEIMQSFEIVE